LAKSARPNDARAGLGHRVREIRKRLGLTLRDVGQTTGLAKSTLSKIENGTLSVSYDNLVKLAHALSIEVSALFADGTTAPGPQANGRRSLARRGSGEIYETPQYRYEMLCGDLNPKRIFPIIATLRAHSVASTSDLIRHPGEEFIYVLDGEVAFHSEFYSTATLRAGDSAYIDSTMGHAFVSAGDADARIMWIATTAPEADHAPAAKPSERPRRAARTAR
jgi:transcriptional regulator with XRE-family HTH domain